VNFNSDLGPNAGLDQSKERRNHYAQVFALLATVTQRFNHVGIFRREVRWGLNSPHECVRPLWWCGGGASGRPQPDPLARWPAPVIAVRRARAARGLRDRAVTAVTGVSAVIAVIAEIVSSGPVRAARTVAKGAVSPVTAVPADRLCCDLRTGRDRRDPSRSSRSHGGHGPTVGAVTAP
jgi:hypothetical protein